MNVSTIRTLARSQLAPKQKVFADLFEDEEVLQIVAGAATVEEAGSMFARWFAPDQLKTNVRPS